MIFTDSELTITPRPLTPETAFAIPDSLGIIDISDIQLQVDGGFGDQLLWLSESCEGTFVGEGNPLIIEKPEQTTTYYAKWENGCGYSACQKVTVFIDDRFEVYAPNAFSPDGDGLNDEFALLSPVDFFAFKLLVFNRWGQQIFESDDLYNGWDGTLNGTNCSVGTYVWKASYQLRKEGSSSVQKMINGTVTIVR